MKIVGIVAEFNPLHNGHKYIIDHARNELKADYIVIAMSGDYVQRGEPAIFDKSLRAKAALLAGVDAVFMLPVTISSASASYYALGATSLLDSLGCSHILFGSENGNIEELKKSEYISGIIDSPNNILAREYIKAIKLLDLKLEPVTLKRSGADYNDSDNIINNKCSASYIRKNFNELFTDSNSSNHNIIPEKIFDLYHQYLCEYSPVFTNDFSSVLLSQLITNSDRGFNQYFDIFSDLSDKIIKNICSFTSFTEFTDLLKSKDITRSHISRALLHICLNITKEDIENIKTLNYCPYARLIAFKKDSDILTILSKNSQIDIISKLSDYINALKNTKDNKSLLKLSLINKDINASHLYSYHTNKGKIINECQKRIVII